MCFKILCFFCIFEVVSYRFIANAYFKFLCLVEILCAILSFCAMRVDMFMCVTLLVLSFAFVVLMC